MHDNACTHSQQICVKHNKASPLLFSVRKKKIVTLSTDDVGDSRKDGLLLLIKDKHKPGKIS